MRGRAWTNEEDAILKQMIDDNIPYSTIAETLGRSEKSVINRAYRLKFTRKMGFQKGPLNPNWKGGKRITSYGYVEIYVPQHHRARTTGYVFEHIVAAERKYERVIEKGEQVHHIDEDKENNSPENLFLFASASDHAVFHRYEGKGVDIPLLYTYKGSEWNAKSSSAHRKINEGQ